MTNIPRGRGEASALLPMVAMFLAGAVAFGLVQKHNAEQKIATFVRRCPNLSTSNPMALRTPEGRLVIVSMIDVPEQFASSFCPDPNELKASLGLSDKAAPRP